MKATDLKALDEKKSMLEGQFNRYRRITLSEIYEDEQIKRGFESLNNINSVISGVQQDINI